MMNCRALLLAAKGAPEQNERGATGSFTDRLNAEVARFVPMPS
jgi:hypothetical protein